MNTSLSVRLDFEPASYYTFQDCDLNNRKLDLVVLKSGDISGGATYTSLTFETPPCPSGSILTSHDTVQVAQLNISLIVSA
jgi:hypothetical protein